MALGRWTGPLVAAAVLSLLVLGAGCVPQKRVTLASSPPGATVTIDGLPAGQTPVTKELVWTTGQDDDVKHAVFQLEGYDDAVLLLKWLPVAETSFLVNMKRWGETAQPTPAPATPAGKGPFCPTCGAQLQASYKFCPGCGKPR